MHTPAATLLKIRDYLDNAEFGADYRSDLLDILDGNSPFGLSPVIVTVYGGVAEVAQQPEGVDVEIIDFDNLRNLLYLDGSGPDNIVISDNARAYLAEHDAAFFARIDHANAPAPTTRTCPKCDGYADINKACPFCNAAPDDLPFSLVNLDTDETPTCYTTLADARKAAANQGLAHYEIWDDGDTLRETVDTTPGPKCSACGRGESICSRNPCAAVVADREA